MKLAVLLMLFITACDHSLTAPDSAYCPKKIDLIPHADTTYQISGLWEFTIIHIWTEQKVTWVKCNAQ